MHSLKWYFLDISYTLLDMEMGGGRFLDINYALVEMEMNVHGVLSIHAFLEVCVSGWEEGGGGRGDMTCAFLQ
ncbi:hypothetical protein BaRGS_00005898, partial [Batillaria attramentaria]